MRKMPASTVGKEILPQKEDQSHGEDAEQQERRDEERAMVHGGAQRAVISVTKLLKPALKTNLEALERSKEAGADPEFVFMLMVLEEIHHQRRNQRAREQVRRHHGENHGFSQRNEQELRYARKEEHGHKHNADAQRGNKRRHRDLRSAVQNGLLQFFSLGQIAIDVFNFHRGVIHKDADGQRQPSQGHDVESLAQGRKADDRAKNG